MKRQDSYIQIRVGQQLKEALKNTAKSQNKKPSKVLRELITLYIDIHSTNKPDIRKPGN